MKHMFMVVVGIAALSLSAPAFAAKGVVVLRKSSCDYYLVDTNMGFALLEWYGGNDPSRGETLTGDFESYGMKEIYNLSSDSETQVWVEDYWLSKDRAVEKFYDKCN